MIALLNIVEVASALPAYVPFKTPMNVLQEWWYLLLVPLAFGIALTYKALRLGDLSHIWRQTFLMTVQIIVAIIGLAVVLGLFILLVIPHLPVQ